MNHVTIGDGCSIQGSVICSNAQLEERAVLKDCQVISPSLPNSSLSHSYARTAQFHVFSIFSFFCLCSRLEQVLWLPQAVSTRESLWLENKSKEEKPLLGRECQCEGVFWIVQCGNLRSEENFWWLLPSSRAGDTSGKQKESLASKDKYQS